MLRQKGVDKRCRPINFLEIHLVSVLLMKAKCAYLWNMKNQSEQQFLKNPSYISYRMLIIKYVQDVNHFKNLFMICT